MSKVTDEEVSLKHWPEKSQHDLNKTLLEDIAMHEKWRKRNIQAICVLMMAVVGLFAVSIRLMMEVSKL